MEIGKLDIRAKCGATSARAAELTTNHGVVKTPVFCPVGSQASVKTLTPDELKTLDYEMILSNNYHLYLRPGSEFIKEFGGLHKFMNWDRAILTDSGGYQLFSLSPLTKITDEGVTFRSHIDGSSHFITPEKAVNLQQALGSDIMMVLDDVPPTDADFYRTREAVKRTHAWAKRCLGEWHKEDGNLLYAIVQGGIHKELRKESALGLCEMDFPGFAVGGLSLGEPKEVMFDMIAETLRFLPQEKPRYLMGVGSPEDLVLSVALGVDIFDCVLPTRIARNGSLFTHKGRVNINNAYYKTFDGPIEEGCTCYMCSNFSAAYLNHLFRCKELLAYRLATMHNLHFMKQLMLKVRSSIIEGTFDSFKDSFLEKYNSTDEKVRLEQRKKWLNRTRGDGFDTK